MSTGGARSSDGWAEEEPSHTWVVLGVCEYGHNHQTHACLGLVQVSSSQPKRKFKRPSLITAAESHTTIAFKGREREGAAVLTKWLVQV